MFQETFALTINERPTDIVDEELYELRYLLMMEENEEYLEACRKGDLLEIADSMGDNLYILPGTKISPGLQDKIEEVFAENYFKPDLQSILAEQED